MDGRKIRSSYLFVFEALFEYAALKLEDQGRFGVDDIAILECSYSMYVCVRCNVKVYVSRQLNHF